MPLAKAKKPVPCHACEHTVNRGEAIYFYDGKIYCQDCAEDWYMVCPICHGQKLAEYNECYSCANL